MYTTKTTIGNKKLNPKPSGIQKPALGWTLQEQRAAFPLAYKWNYFTVLFQAQAQESG